MVAINDPRYVAQWHFGLLGDIEAIWQDYSGQGVAVGVYDDGMDQTHQDLAANYDASLHYRGHSYSDDGRYSNASDGHGTSVGGLIGAALNGIGGIGVAWGVRLTSVNYLVNLQSRSFETQLDALEYGAAFDIVNQSYGVSPEYDPTGDIGDANSWAWEEAQAFLHAASVGRGGLGTVFLKAAGNDANDSNYASYGIYGNAQGEGHNSLHTVITVGAYGQGGQVASYSNYGHSLLVSAPAASHTTDVTGTAGYESGANTDGFGGTSAATPVTAGVVALMLEANPDLGYRDVQNILAASAAQVGSAYGSALATGDEVGVWMGLGGNSWNGGAMTFHQSYGYGAVDAFAAVRLAEVWGLFNAQALTQSNLITQSYSASASALISSDAAPARATITVDEGIMIEHVYVTVDLTHSYAGDLVLDLLTPDGEVINLANQEGADSEITDDWTFGVASLRGMSSAGDWTVQVTDNAGGDDGRLIDVALEFLGSGLGATSATAGGIDDLWTVTDDFQSLAGVDQARSRFDDTNGGTDWLNTVAVARGLGITLGETSGEGSLSQGRNLWARLEGGAIENVASGDGNDVITGSAADNVIMAGRGQNIVQGGSGADSLSGLGTANVLIAEDRGLYGSSQSAQIFRLYDTVFGREPDMGGHQSFAAQLAAGTTSLTALAASFVVSREFINRYGSDTSDAEFVTLAYDNVLGRVPSEREITAWTDRMGSGMSRAEVVFSFSESREHINLTASALAEYELAADPTEWAGYVYRIFGAIFDREPGAVGFDLWVAAVVDGYGPDGLVQAFMNSTEFQNVYGGTSNESFARKLYQNVLDREPEQRGLDAWVRALDNGLTRQEAVQRFAGTQEYVTATEPALNQYMLALGSDDRLAAGSATAMLSGGLYSDTFVFAAPGSDLSVGTLAPATQQVVTDFESWDRIQLSGFGYASTSDAHSHFSQIGSDVVFSDTDIQITFLDSGLAEITENSLVLV